MTTILFVPGAWITPAFYQPFIYALRVAGYDVHYAGYPSLDPKDPLVTDCQADTDAITGILRYLVEDEGKDVVVFMHSYAGMPGSAAASGLAKSQRAQKENAGGVIGLIFLGAFVVAEGLSCAGLQGGNLPAWILPDQPSANLNIVDDPIRNFAADVDPHLARSLVAAVEPHSTLAFTSPQPHPAWADEAFQGRLAFIVTTEDVAVPQEAQSGMMAATEKAWIIREIASSHCAPFANRIDETVGLMRGIIGQFI
ncbi:uncharacterized protein N7479_001215 [Penicillium vulpinum]|uniref:AB hydrolase-1 domain-containing protein n=1 Tax=Penicillium vulpinum TaxID=29845 RepID=A0A1V6RZX1_9EURO|nr:uncharacterized protein N7479_001215 [Penicillium vulpinum]KAJ5971297.1 hypothetical protein N7479_001215 [Penicillium vulpinum]OQE07010.1 hypothetical protein PENVUL_c015G01289 [Penicillium vulpinum]